MQEKVNRYPYKFSIGNTFVPYVHIPFLQTINRNFLMQTMTERFYGLEILANQVITRNNRWICFLSLYLRNARRIKLSDQ